MGILSRFQPEVLGLSVFRAGKWDTPTSIGYVGLKGDLSPHKL